MEYIITESQYKRLTEDNDDDDFQSYLTKRFPKINNLKMETSNKSTTGLTRRYFDPEKNELYFRVALRNPELVNLSMTNLFVYMCHLKSIITQKNTEWDLIISWKSGSIKLIMKRLTLFLKKPFYRN